MSIFITNNSLSVSAHSQPCGSQGYDNGSVVLSDYLGMYI